MGSCNHEEIAVERVNYYYVIVCEVCGNTLRSNELTSNQLNEVDEAMKLLDDLLAG